MGANTVIAVPKFRGEIRYDEPMSRHSSWRAGGKADCYCIPQDLDDLVVLLQLQALDEKLFWLGLGSNVLVREGGLRGTVIAMQGVTSQLELLDDEVPGIGRVVVGAGVTDAKLARFCARENLVGAEFFAGIPGLVGGALAMNAGAFGGETWRHVVAVKTIDRNGVIRKRTPADYQIDYRSVVGPADEWFIEATLQFERDEHSHASADIKALLAKRAETQPTGSANSGSVFRNPPGEYAARLIEQCGLKGRRIGGAVVSEKHANFIVNDDKATASDIESLIVLIQQTVLQQCDIELHTEVVIVGEEES